MKPKEYQNSRHLRNNSIENQEIYSHHTSMRHLQEVDFKFSKENNFHLSINVSKNQPNVFVRFSKSILIF